MHKTVYFQSLAISLTPAIPAISAIVTFLAHLSSGSNLIASQVYIILFVSVYIILQIENEYSYYVDLYLFRFLWRNIRISNSKPNI